jgi:hypothetical protein
MTKPNNPARRLAALLLLSLTCAAAAGAQQQRAYKIEETDYTRCDVSEIPQLSQETMPLFVEMGRHPRAKAAVVVYADQPGEALSYARRITSRLSGTHGVTAERLLEVYGGFAEKKRVEIWLVPAGAEPPRQAPGYTPAGVTMFDSYSYWRGDDCSYEREVALEVFAETLKRMPGWRATLVVRPHLNRRGLTRKDEGWDEAQMNLRQARRQAAKDRLHLVRQLGLDPSRIKAVVGARGGEWSRAELWLIPPAAQTPNGR